MEKSFIEGELNSVEDHEINERIISQACDIAESLTELECKLSGIKCWNKEMSNGTEISSYTEEAQDIFDGYYDKYITELYDLLNSQLKVINA